VERGEALLVARVGRRGAALEQRARVVGVPARGGEQEEAVVALALAVL
jgi:hypothetical protein